MKHLLMVGAAALVLTACGDKAATDVKAAGDKTTDAVKVATTSDRTAGYSETKNAYFGETHVHTRNSFDAYIFNVRNEPADVYRYAKGETIVHPSGFEMKLNGPPLDFAAVTDHAAYLGILPALDNPDHKLSKLPIAKEMFGTDPEVIVGAFQKIGGAIRNGTKLDAYDQETIDSAWAQTVAAADKYYEPGVLTTFAGYEYTAVSVRKDSPDSFIGGNLHRNVFFENEAPSSPFSTIQSTNPEDLWDWMDTERAAGRDALAIPHNSNVSDGEMFAKLTTNGRPLDADYAKQRMMNEPIVEISQVKGTSETHPLLSPNDEWANFEIYDKLLSSDVVSKTKGGFVREAYANGIGMENAEGFNPYKFGVISASDSHVAGGAFDEKDYWSKVGILDGTSQARGSVPPGDAKTWDGVERDANGELWFSRWGASGLAGVWAEENTRESIFGAMRKKETFATSGPRIKVRFFGGYGFEDNDLANADLAGFGYENGVPMGGDMSGNGEAPSFLAWAMRDPKGAPLQRLQIIKVWNEDGTNKEMVYDAACSDGNVPDENYRCADNGASVDMSNCSPSTGSGDPELKTVWQDPDFDTDQRAAYYVRVLENPTCRWSTYDALRSGTPPHPDLPQTIQDRAWSSAIWYNP